MELTRSEENYLKAILILRERHGYVRAVDVAKYLSITRASVSNAVRNLQSNGFLTTDENKFLMLTPAGEQIAQTRYGRQRLFIALLEMAGVEAELAQQEAGDMLQSVSDDSYEKLKRLFLSCGIVKAGECL